MGRGASCPAWWAASTSATGWRAAASVDGIRHEDALALSFADAAFDAFMSNDVFEHVPDAPRAFAEAARVLRPDGVHVFGIPCYADRVEAARGAELREGQLVHLLEPQYHGNPVGDGQSLVFYDYGWDVLRVCTGAGFADAWAIGYSERDARAPRRRPPDGIRRTPLGVRHNDRAVRRIASFTVTPEQYRMVAYAALVVCTLIVFTGAAVRVTGSGLGCPDWPRCDGTSLTPELSSHALIEFGNRLLTGVVGIPCLLAAILAWRRRPFRRDIALVALLLPLGVAGQAVLGGLTVIYGLEPSWVIGHFLLSMVLLIACVALVWKARYEKDARPPGTDTLTRWAIRGLVAFGGVVLVAGTVATAAGPHAGGERHGRHRAPARLPGGGHVRLGHPPARRAGHGARPRRRRHLVPGPRPPRQQGHAGLAHRGLRAAGVPGLRRRGAVRDGGAGDDGVDPRRARRADMARAAVVRRVVRSRR